MLIGPLLLSLLSAASLSLPVVELARRCLNSFFIFLFHLFIFKNIYLFIWLHWVLVVARRTFVSACRLFCCVARALERAGLVVAARGLSYLVARGILVPRPGIELEPWQ